MTYELIIKRRKSADEASYEQVLSYESSGEADTVATALININRGALADDPVAWECSCLQKKCGACAMVINGVPGLACDSRLSEVSDKNGKIRIEPLRKFPVVRDLICDRSVMRENLKAISAWLNEDSDVKLTSDRENILFEAGKCLQCGCCLEVCPNFYAGGSFFGMSAMAPVAGMLEKLTYEESKELRRSYSKHVYAGCAKSLSCRDICPADLDIEKLLVNSNAVALWKRLIKRGS